MTDPQLLAKRLALIETGVAELRRLARPELLDTDVREERFVEHTLQIAIQAAQDVPHTSSPTRGWASREQIGSSSTCCYAAVG